MGKEEEQYLHEEEFDLEMYDNHPGGENLDGHTKDHVSLVFKVLDKFPDLCKRHRTFIGTTAVVSTSLFVLTGIVIAFKKHKGESDESILGNITEDEIENGAIEIAQDMTDRHKKKDKPSKKKK